MLVHAEPQLVFEADGSQEPKRVVTEDCLRNSPDDADFEVSPPAVRVVQVPAPDPNGHRVEREVARSEIGVDPARERREVDGLGGSLP